MSSCLHKRPHTVSVFLNVKNLVPAHDGTACSAMIIFLKSYWHRGANRCLDDVFTCHEHTGKKKKPYHRKRVFTWFDGFSQDPRTDDTEFSTPRGNRIEFVQGMKSNFRATPKAVENESAGAHKNREPMIGCKIQLPQMTRKVESITRKYFLPDPRSKKSKITFSLLYGRTSVLLLNNHHGEFPRTTT